jgi:lysophospholipase L1-like esterase
MGVLVIPPLAGAVAAGLARKRFHRWMRGAAPVFVTAFAAPVLATVVALAAPVGLWDALFGALSMGAAFLFVGHAAMAQRGVRLILIASCLISGALAEGAVRALFPTPPAVSPAAQQRFFLRPRLRDRGRATFAPNFGKEVVCAVVYDDWGFPEHDAQTLVPREFVPPPGHARRVLHLGDSMTWGAGVPSTDTFPAQLGALEPESLHVNAGIPAIGPDGYLALAHRWLPVFRPDLVVVSVFAGNDLIDLDSPYPCCEWGPLLTYDGPAPSLRCPTARGLESRGLPLEWLRSTSPPPYLLRTTAAVSAFSAYATAAFLRAERRAPTIGEDVTLAHFGAIVAALRDESRTQAAELAVVVLPPRAALASPSPRETVGFRTGASLVDVARREHILVLDAWDLFEAESLTRGVDPLFADAVHFSRVGHEIVASWLHRNLPAATARRGGTG